MGMMSISDSNNDIYHELSKLIMIQGLVPSLAAMLLCVALTAANHTTGVPIIANKYLESVDSIEKKIEWIEYVRNGMFKSIVLCGTPRVINAEVALYKSLPKEYQALLRTEPLNNKQVTNLWDTRGKDMFLKIYGGNSTDREDTMKSANPDLWYWCKEGYGDYISDSTYLDYAETELEVIVSLIQMDALPQLNDHKLGAERVGATDEQIKAAEQIGYKVRDALNKK